MRKTAVAVSAIRRSSSRSRGSKQPEDGSNNKEQPPPSQNQQQQKQQQSQQQQQQRKQHSSANTRNPDDVLALTAKNYRLAKELSELRVRHREECKKQTRLSMENMNISSKYRDCLQQISVLKKEVAYYQRRVEVLAKNNGVINRPLNASLSASSPEKPPSQEMNAPSSSNSSPLQVTKTTNTSAAAALTSSPSPRTCGLPASALVTPRKAKDAANAALADVVAEMNRMDQILAEHAKKSSSENKVNNSGNHEGAATSAVVSVGLQQQEPRTESSTPPTASVTMTTESSTPQSTTSSLTASPSTPLEKHPQQPAIVVASSEGLVSSDDFETDTVELENVDDEPSSPPEAMDARPPIAGFSNVDKETKEGEEWESSQNNNISSQGGSNKPTTNARTGFETPSSFFAHSASPLKFQFNEEYPGDIVASVRHKKTQRNAIGRLDESKEDEEQQPPYPSISSTQSVSSIDAFEASFHTDFPDSFSSPKDGSSIKSSNESSGTGDQSPPKTYNPFSNSPAQVSYDWRGGDAATGGRGPIYSAPIVDRSVGGSDPPGKDHTSPRKKPPKSPVTTDASAKGLLPQFNLTGNKKHAPANEETLPPTSHTLLTTLRSPLSGSGAFLLQTPPPPAAPSSSPPAQVSSSPSLPYPKSNNLYRTPPPMVSYSPSTGSGSEHLKRPEKTGHEVARARREKVLQPRSASSQQGQPTPAPSAAARPPHSSSTTQSSPPPSDEREQLQLQSKVLDPMSRDAILANARDRLSASSYAYTTPPSKAPLTSLSENNVNKSVLWSENLSNGYDDDGDIPLRSSLTKNMEMRIRMVDNYSSNINSANNISQPKRSLWQHEDDLEQEEDPSNSPRLHNRLIATTMATPPPPPPVNQQRRLEATILSTARF